MKTFELFLDNKQKTTCPACGRRKCFSPYVYHDSHKAVNAEVCGKCDRLDNCGYHLPPREYFKSHPGNEPGRRRRPRRDYDGRIDALLAGHVRLRQVAPTYIAPPVVEATINRNRVDNPLYRYITSLYKRLEIAGITAHIDAVFDRYRIGTSTRFGGSTLFWFANGDGRVSDGKIMGFDPVTGKRIKKPYPQITWVSSTIKQPPQNPVRSYFGAHLAADMTDADIVLVESEKTALQLAVTRQWLFHDNPWHRNRCVVLATGGCGGISITDPAKKAVLWQRRVILVPDAGKFDEWKAKATELIEAGVCTDCRVSDIMERYVDRYGPGSDVEDLVRRAVASGGADAPWHLLLPATPATTTRFILARLWEEVL